MKLNLKRRIRKLLEPGEGLQQRVIRSGAWVLALRVTERVFGLIRLGILARILAPNDFGLLGIALLAMVALETFSQTGFHAALIQKKENVEQYLDATWTVSVLRGLVLFSLLFLGAPLAASFFNAPEATNIIRLIAVVPLLQGLANPGVIYFQKDLEFGKVFLLAVSRTLADFAVVVSTALILRSVWALVFGLLAGAVVRLILSYVIHPYRPRPRLDLAQSRELFGFGKWILAGAMLTFLITAGNKIFLGKVLGVASLGLYSMAYRFSSAPAMETAQVLTRVTFPAYSKLQDNLLGLREGFMKTLQLTAFVAVPMAGGIFIVAPEFTKILLGDKWLPMVSAMQALALWGLLSSIRATMGPVCLAVGRPDIPTKLQMVGLIILAGLIHPLSMKWGIQGVALALVFSSLFVVPVMYQIVVKSILKGSRVYIAQKALLVPFIGTSLMVLLLSFFANENAPLWQFALEVCGGAAFYFVVAYGLDKLLKCGIYDNLRLAIFGAFR